MASGFLEDYTNHAKVPPRGRMTGYAGTQKNDFLRRFLSLQSIPKRENHTRRLAVTILRSFSRARHGLWNAAAYMS